MTDPAWAQGDGSATDRLWLADWRRRTGTLYAEVRAMAATDPAIALAHWRAVREQLYREHPQSPVPAAERASFTARHFDHDPRPALRGGRGAGPSPGARHVRPRTAEQRGGHASRSAASERCPCHSPGARGPLSVFWMAGYAGGIFVPFRDATNGTETYAAGRYLLDAAKSFDLGGDPVAGTLVLDFNFAVQPSCAFDPRWACPLAPPENRLDVPIRAGERLA